MTRRAVAETLGAHMALSSPTAELWRRVALGELSPDEAEATVLGERTDEGARDEAERARVVFAPVAEARREALLEQLLARRRADDDVVMLPERAAHAQARRRRARAMAAIGIVVALAAMLLLWVPPRAPDTFAAQYELELSGMTAGTRGADPSQEPPGELPTFATTGTIRVGLRPADPVAGPIEIVGFARSASGAVQPLSLEAVVRPSGKVDVEVPASALGHAGTWELSFAVGRPEALPRSWEQLRGGGAGYVVVRGEVRIVPEPPRSKR